MEVELGGAVEAHKVVGQLPQPENLSSGKSIQVGKDRGGLVPVVADPGQWIEGQAESVTSQTFQQMPRRPPGTQGIGGQFRPIPGDLGSIIRSESGPELRQAYPFANVLLSIPSTAVHFTLQGHAQRKQFGPGEVEAIAASPRNRLERQVLEELAFVGAAETNTPRYAFAGITGQTEGTMPRANLLVIQYY